MIKVILKNESDLRFFVLEHVDKNPFVNTPEEYPCLLVDDYYKLRHETNQMGRFLGIVYLKDVLDLFPKQLCGEK